MDVARNVSAISPAGLEPPSSRSRVEHALGALVEVAVAALVAVEIVMLLTGVFARYILHMPLVWVDELASILFLWLATLGAAIAMQRREHMRMTAAAHRLSDHTKFLLDALAVAAPVAFLVLMLPAAFAYTHEEYVIRTPALDVSNAWRTAAIPGRHFRDACLRSVAIDPREICVAGGQHSHCRVDSGIRCVAAALPDR